MAVAPGAVEGDDTPPVADVVPTAPSLLTTSAVALCCDCGTPPPAPDCPCALCWEAGGSGPAGEFAALALAGLPTVPHFDPNRSYPLRRGGTYVYRGTSPPHCPSDGPVEHNYGVADVVYAGEGGGYSAETPSPPGCVQTFAERETAGLAFADDPGGGAAVGIVGGCGGFAACQYSNYEVYASGINPAVRKFPDVLIGGSPGSPNYRFAGAYGWQRIVHTLSVHPVTGVCTRTHTRQDVEWVEFGGQATDAADPCDQEGDGVLLLAGQWRKVVAGYDIDQAGNVVADEPVTSAGTFTAALTPYCEDLTVDEPEDPGDPGGEGLAAAARPHPEAARLAAADPLLRQGCCG